MIEIQNLSESESNVHNENNVLKNTLKECENKSSNEDFEQRVKRKIHQKIKNTLRVYLVKFK